MQTAPKKVVNAWAMYDWANSAYNLVITSTIFPAYFLAVTGDGNAETKADKVKFLGREFVNSSLNEYALAFSFLIVALISPLLSSIADYKGNKKKFLGFFLTMGSLSCCALFFFEGTSTLAIGIAGMVIACIGYWASLVFYNSYLPEIASIEDRDRISAKGFAYGYVGSVILQLVCFVFVIKYDWFGITEAFGSRLSFVLVGIWWFAFGMWALGRLPKPRAAGTGDNRNIITKGYQELHKVWKQLTHMKTLKRYLLSFFFFNMGVQTVMLASALYAKEELQIPTDNLILAILLIQLIAIPGAFAMSALSKRIGNIKALMVCVIIWILICIAAYYVPAGGINEFYMLAASIGLIMGGIQALSRSTYAKLMPETVDTASFFSFYDVSEKIAAVIGMLSFGLLIEYTHSQRASVLALMVYFIIGFLLLLYVQSAVRSEKTEARVKSF